MNKKNPNRQKKPDPENTRIGAHAILITTDQKIILQQRDPNPLLVNPGLISMFGGTLNKNEKPVRGLKRELKEELDLDPAAVQPKKIALFLKTKKLDGIDFKIHVFAVDNIDPEKIIVREGKPLFFKKSQALLRHPRLTRITRLALKRYLGSQNLTKN